jgi:ornithine cyclodeaminase/alanine dehydrogenase-like protein (mu-crystallin family)
VHAVEAGVVGRDDVTQLGDVLAGNAAGRASTGEITVFDSTGLAIQDLAVGIEVVNRYRAGIGEGSFSSVQEIDIG